MARTFSVLTQNYVACSIGTCGAVGSGAFTLMALVNLDVSNNSGGVISFFNTTTMRAEILIDTKTIFGLGDFGGGQTDINPGSWYWVAVRKSTSGTSKYRYSRRLYNSGTTTHQDSAASFTDNGSSNAIRLGDAEEHSNGSIAAWAAWTSALTDANIEAAFTTAAADIAALSPAGLWLGNQASSSDPIADSTGNGADQTSVVGTVGVGTDPPSYDYTLTGGSTDHPGAVAPSVTATFTPAAHRIRPGAISASAVATLAPTPHQTHAAAISSAVTATLTPTPTHIRPAAITATAAATLTPAAVHTRPAAITATAEAELLLTVGGQNQAAASGTATAAVALATAHTRAAAVSLTAVASMVSAASKTGTHAITAGVLARMIATITSAIMRDITVTYGPPELAWSFGPPETTWRFGPPET